MHQGPPNTLCYNSNRKEELGGIKTKTGINLMQKIKYFSTFSGIGGFELGIENAATTLRPAAKHVSQIIADKLPNSNPLTK